MVSIFAAEVYSDSQTVSLDDDFVLTNLDDKFTPPTQSIDATLGGFTYVEKAILSWEFVPDLNYTSVQFDRSVDINIVPTLEFDGTLDLFTDVGSQNIFTLDAFENVSETTDGKQEVSTTIDTYVDTPAVVGYDFSTSGSGSVRVEGNQTVDIEVTIQFIGRQP